MIDLVILSIAKFMEAWMENMKGAIGQRYLQGMILTYNGSIIDALYHSNSGELLRILPMHGDIAIRI